MAAIEGECRHHTRRATLNDTAGAGSPRPTFISLALTADVNVHWLEQQTGVSYQTMRKHHGRYMRSEGASELAKLEQLDPDLDPADEAESVSDEKQGGIVVRGGGLEPPRPIKATRPST